MLLLLAITYASLYSQQQQIKIVSFTVKNKLPAVVDTWNNIPGAVMLVAQKPPTIRVEGLILVVQVRANGAILCGNNPGAGLPVDDFTTRSFSASELIGMLSGCHDLKDGNYSICAQFFNREKRAVSDEVCREFIVETPKATEYAPPTLISPTNGFSFLQKDMQKPVIFRWTPVVPKPREPVTYRLKVWQLMEGQTGIQAMRSNQPIITKDVDNITQAVINNLYTGPCKPPYLCDFIWNVQALNREGNPIGNNNGTSEPFAFSIMGNYGITIQTLKVDCAKGNSYGFTVNVGNPNPSIAIFDKIEVVVINGVTITPINITPTVPAIGSTIAANGNINLSGSFTYGSPIITVCLKAYIKEQANPLLNTASSYTCDTLRCACDPCKTLGVTIKDDKLTTTASTSGQILLSGLLSGLNPAIIKKITMELVYYNIEQTGDSNCVKCAENREWGNFIKPSSAYFSGFSPGILNGINFGREWTWLTTVKKDCDDNGGGHGNGDGGVDHGNPKAGAAYCATCGTSNVPFNPNVKDAKMANNVPVIIIDPVPLPKQNSFSIPIAVPPGSSLKCCGDKIKICIRFTIWDFCCHACDVVKCYEIERKAQ